MSINAMGYMDLYIATIHGMDAMWLKTGATQMIPHFQYSLVNAYTYTF